MQKHLVKYSILFYINFIMIKNENKKITKLVKYSILFYINFILIKN